MVMYRAHCQRVLDSIVRATFDEVSIPVHVSPVCSVHVCMHGIVAEKFISITKQWYMYMYISNMYLCYYTLSVCMYSSV